MEYIYIVMSVLGFIGFLYAVSNSSKISKLEREIRLLKNSVELPERKNLAEYLRENIGKRVELEFYEEDTFDYQFQYDKITITDMDDKWLLLHLKNAKQQTDVLIRIDSVKNFEVVSGE